MRRGSLLVLILQVVLSRSVWAASVSVYLGETAVLRPGVQPTEFSKVEWSVYTNNTWIATYREGRGTNTERVDRFKGRLGLNVFTGDLTIHNVTSGDSMEYTVLLRNGNNKDEVVKVQLDVRQRLEEPKIQKVSEIPSVNGGCLLLFTCSSPHAGVGFSWDSGRPDTDPRPDGWYFATFIRANEVANVTCTITANQEKASHTVKAKCDNEKSQGTAAPAQMPPSREQNGLMIFIGFAFGASVVAIIWFFIGTLQKKLQRLRGSEAEYDVTHPEEAGPQQPNGHVKLDLVATAAHGAAADRSDNQSDPSSG